MGEEDNKKSSPSCGQRSLEQRRASTVNALSALTMLATAPVEEKPESSSTVRNDLEEQEEQVVAILSGVAKETRRNVANSRTSSPTGNIVKTMPVLPGAASPLPASSFSGNKVISAPVAKTCTSATRYLEVGSGMSRSSSPVSKLVLTSPHIDSSRSTRSASPEGSGGPYATGRWTAEEHRLFVKGLETCGRDWRRLAEIITTRSFIQIRTHAQKYFKKLARAVAQSGHEVPQDLTSTASDGKNWAQTSLTKLADMEVLHSSGDSRRSDLSVTKRAGSRLSKTLQHLSRGSRSTMTVKAKLNDQRKHHDGVQQQQGQEKLFRSLTPPGEYPNATSHHYQPPPSTISFAGSWPMNLTSAHTSPTHSRSNSPGLALSRHIPTSPATAALQASRYLNNSTLLAQNLLGRPDGGSVSGNTFPDAMESQSRLYQLQLQQAFLQQQAELEQQKYMNYEAQLHLQHQLLMERQRQQSLQAAVASVLKNRTSGLAGPFAGIQADLLNQSRSQPSSSNFVNGFPSVPTY